MSSRLRRRSIQAPSVSRFPRDWRSSSIPRQSSGSLRTWSATLCATEHRRSSYRRISPINTSGSTSTTAARALRRSLCPTSSSGSAAARNRSERRKARASDSRSHARTPARTAATSSTTVFTTARGSSSSSRPSPSAPDADPAKTDRLNRARVQKHLLERLACRATEPAIEIRTPFEVSLFESGRDLATDHVRRVEVVVFVSPTREIRPSDRLAPGGDQHSMLPLVPVARRVIHPIPRELVEDQDWRHPRDLVQRGTEWIDMVEDPLRDDGVECSLVQLLQRDGLEGFPGGWVVIDAERVVAGVSQRGCDPTFRAAAHLEHARRWRREMRECERGEIHCRQPRTGSSNRGTDRQSTRLNSSHVSISYAVFCLKKKKAPLAAEAFPRRPETAAAYARASPYRPPPGAAHRPCPGHATQPRTVRAP